MIDVPVGARVYVDTNLWIYHVQAVPVWVDRVAIFLDAIMVAGAKLVTSQLAWAECIAKPARENDQAAIQAFDDFFRDGGIELLPFDGELAVRAARRGADIGLKLLDSIHFLSALQNGCTHFATSDRRFRSGGELEVLLISSEE